MDKYLKLRDKDGKLPLYKVKHKDETKYIYTEEGLEDFRKEKQSIAEKEREILGKNEQKQEDGATTVVDAVAVVDEVIEVVEHYENKELDKTIQAINNCIGANGAEKNEYKLVSGDIEILVNSLSDVLSKVREMGRKGLEIQRYKGLGEMNAEELAETTMDINKRTLLKVKVEDAVKADAIFSTLAGKDVQRRREFIEKHALEVRNLDI